MSRAAISVSLNLADAGRFQELQGLHVRVHDGHAVRHDARLDGQREEVRTQQRMPRQQAAPGVVEHELRRVGALARVFSARHCCRARVHFTTTTRAASRGAAAA